MENIRNAIKNDCLADYRQEFFSKYGYLNSSSEAT
jgi:queuine/archaeosine tRNA-ribosyltransferase